MTDDQEKRTTVPSPNAPPASVGRYVGYDVLGKWDSPDFDGPTRDVVRGRLEHVPPVRFFSDAEATTLLAVARRIVPQTERERSEEVPIVPWIDEKLFHDRRDGYRYDTLPPQREAWRLGLAGIDETARELHGRSFADLTDPEQDAQGKPPGDAWERLPAARFFTSVLVQTIAKIYYGHPSAWNEIGYSGPSSPRGHVRNWLGGVDPWDAHESTPPDAAT
jgi:hypothetical protein